MYFARRGREKLRFSKAAVVRTITGGLCLSVISACSCVAEWEGGLPLRDGAADAEEVPADEQGWVHGPEREPSDRPAQALEQPDEQEGPDEQEEPWKPGGRTDKIGESSASRDGDFYWARHAGTELDVIANDHPWVEIVEDRLEEFEENTGITVRFEVYPEDQFRAKRRVEMMSGVSDFDVLMIMPGQALSAYVAEGWVEPLDDLLADDSITAPEYEVDDYYEGVLEAGARDDKQYTMPILLETSLLAYNEELFERFDLSPPETMGELEEAARTVYEGTDGEVYGITLRGNRAAATSQWADFLYSFGGEWLDDQGRAAIDSEEAIESLRFYGGLLRNYGPRDAVRNRWYESVSLFTSGRAAMIYDANVFRPDYEDADRSNVHDRVGYAPIPEGPAGRIPHISHWGLAVSSQSPALEASWLFIQWATGREISAEAHRRGIPSARESIWEQQDPSSSWAEASMASYAAADWQWNPPIINVDAAREVVGRAIVAAILDDNVVEAAQSAAAELDGIIEEEES